MSRFQPRSADVLAVTTMASLALAMLWWSNLRTEAAADQIVRPTLGSLSASITSSEFGGLATVPRLALVTAPPKATASQEKTLAAKVQRLISQSRSGSGSLKDAEIAVSIRACDDGPGPGREIIAINADRPLLPASNMKLIATGAALHVLGPEFVFETRIRGVQDTFIVIGDGDPSLADPTFFSALKYRDEHGERQELDEEAILGFWADAIVAAAPPDGRVSILVDDSVFEARLWNDGTNGRDGWNPNDRLRAFSA